ncbi:WS/DGAT/MGAT family O-acyltransferase [Antrihabitans stalactiti]|uniref:Diacylglycerol O-acyltransferase n=1 Tax=Antrihabitans stalactiti TaxID=2584121 RepID=A0A848K906_9NOCA|nr:wax ester/triacylglycerol synthase family O-acyltransferase [Antrihabitans stalactiti]NMN93908.1 wax ester/triacylglycerol synthase family O-acyltransferase [Antrihabitans stalactiti]
MSKQTRSPIKHPLNLVDRGFFLFESDEAYCHVGLRAIFTPPEGAGPEFVRELVASMRERHDVAPTFTYTLAHHLPPLLLGPWLQLDPTAVDLDYHFRHSALPRPGSQRELGILISRLHSRPLDPSRPMWEQHIIEGLEDGRFALYFKVHHALMDGVAGTQAFIKSLATDPANPVARPIWTVDPHNTGAGPSVQPRIATLSTGLRGIVAGVADAGRLVLDAAKKVSEVRDPKNVLPFGGPTSPTLNGRISRQRRAVTQTYELTRLKAVSAAYGVTLNDVFLAICAAALRRYLEDIGEPQVRSLTAGVPVSLRQPNVAAGGNAVSMVLAKLHTELADPVERLNAINRSTSDGKAALMRKSPAAREREAVLIAGPLVAQSLLGIAGRGGLPHANLVLSNVPGPPAPHYLGGATLEEAYPLSMLMHSQALNITAFSTGGRLNIGIVGCRDKLPHLQRMANYLAVALAELEAVAKTHV